MFSNKKEVMSNNHIFLNKSGQTTIFIILGILIVVAGLLIYFLSPQFGKSTRVDTSNPQGFIEACIKEDIQNAISLLSNRGGSLNPTHYIAYNNEKIEYLCYSNENYKPCVMQQPFLGQHIGTEIAINIS